jgi:hypothetical protein
MEVQIKALRIKAVGGQRSNDGQFGLIKFVREKPEPNGQDHFWVAIPNRLLAHLAGVAIRQLPLPGKGTTKPIPFAFPATGVEVGTGFEGGYFVTMEIERGAISYRLDREKAAALMIGLQSSLGQLTLTRPESSKPN